jgi:hypothetical protein
MIQERHPSRREGLRIAQGEVRIADETLGTPPGTTVPPRRVRIETSSQI